MKKIVLVLMCSGIALAYAVDDITVVEINDFHGQMQPHKNMVGAAKIASFLQEYRKQYPNLVIVSGGDNYQGTAISNLSKGAVVNDFFNYIGMSYSAIGNHDFDYGQAVFESWNKANQFKFVAANVIESATGKVVNYAVPYGQLQLPSSKKIAFIGLATLETPETTAIKNIQGLDFVDPVPAANKWVDFLNSKDNKQGKPDVIVLLTHIPTEQESGGKIIYDPNTKLGMSEIKYVTKNVHGIKAVLTGHSHMVVDGYLNGAAVVQGASQGKDLSVLHIDCHTKASCSVTPEIINLSKATESVPADSYINKLIDKYYQQNQAILNQKITTSGMALSNMPESGFYNIKLTYAIADVLRKSTNSDIALQNTYGIRRSLPAGIIDYNMLYEAMPFDNTVVTAKISGKELLSLIRHSLPSGVTQLGVFAGISLTLDSKGKIDKVLVNGKPLEVNKTYSIATLDFLINGGDGFDFKTATAIDNTNIPVRDVIKQYWQKNGIKLSPQWQYITLETK